MTPKQESAKLRVRAANAHRSKDVGVGATTIFPVKMQGAVDDLNATLDDILGEDETTPVKPARAPSPSKAKRNAKKAKRGK